MTKLTNVQPPDVETPAAVTTSSTHELEPAPSEAAGMGILGDTAGRNALKLSGPGAPQKWPAPATNAPAPASPRKKPLAPDSVSVSLSEAAAADPTLHQYEDSCPKYVEMVRRALLIEAGEGFADVEALDCFRVAVDKQGRPCYIFLPAHLPKDVDMERVTMYVFMTLHKRVIREHQRFTALWLCNNRDTASRLGVRWFRRTFRNAPSEFLKRCSVLCLVHPPLWVRLNMFVLSFGFTLGCSKYSLWKKLDFTERLEFLEHYVSKDVIRSLPEEVKMYDCELDEMMYEQMHSNSSMGGHGGHGMSMGGHGMDSGLHGYGSGGGMFRRRHGGRDSKYGGGGRMGSMGSMASSHFRSAQLAVGGGDKAQAQHDARHRVVSNPHLDPYSEATSAYGPVSKYAQHFDIPKRSWE